MPTAVEPEIPPECWGDEQNRLGSSTHLLHRIYMPVNPLHKPLENN